MWSIKIGSEENLNKSNIFEIVLTVVYNKLLILSNYDKFLFKGTWYLTWMKGVYDIFLTLIRCSYERHHRKWATTAANKFVAHTKVSVVGEKIYISQYSNKNHVGRQI